MTEEKIIIKNKKGKKIVGVLHIPKREHIHHKLSCVIICHGFTGFKEETHLVNLAKGLEEHYIIALRFDFTNSGESEGSWENITITQEIEDLKSVIDYVEKLDFVDKNKIGLVGHSLGGLVSIYVALQDERIKCLIGLAPAIKIGKEDTWFDINKWKEQDYLEFETFLNKYGKIKVNYSFIVDAEKYNSREAVKEIKIPFLILHGDKDDIIPLEKGKDLYKNANEPKLLRIIEGANHDFKEKAILALIIKYVVDYFVKYLK